MSKEARKDNKEHLNAFFTASLRNRKFKISCCVLHGTSCLLLQDRS